jgi:HD superfamily phosphodiesterase
MNEAFLGREFFVPRSPSFSASASRSNVRTEVLSKIKFNGVGGTQTYLSFTHFGGSILLKTSIGRRRTMNINLKTNVDLAGIRIPDSKLAREITVLVRDTESPLLFHHSSRVYYWGALAGKRRGLRFDPELLYAGAMFHDMGLTHQHSSTQERFEVDSANTARDFLRSHGVHQQDVETVWTAIALHTTPGIPQHMHPVVALVTAGVEMDVLGLTYAEYSDAEREAVVHAHPRSDQFKEDIIQAFYDGIKHKPDTTFGNVKADVLADKDPAFRRGNFCSVIRGSAWRA